MTQIQSESIYHYFVTAPVTGASASLAQWQHRLRRAVVAETADTHVVIHAMACTPERLIAVVSCGYWMGAPRYRPARLWHRQRVQPLLRSLLPGLTAQSLIGLRNVAERVDYCHYAPVHGGLCRFPEDWALSTASANLASDMLLVA
jgi:hypothetical protein